MPSTALGLVLAASLTVLVLCSPSTCAAQLGTSGPYAHVLDPQPGGTSFGLGSFSAYERVVAPFRPDAPETGLPLLLAYAPSPLLFVDLLFRDDAIRRDIVIIQLVAGALGTLVSGWALYDALQRESQADIAFASLATAHALAWNLQMTIASSVRLALGQLDGPTVDAAVPMVMAFPVRGGAGLGPQWIF